MNTIFAPHPFEATYWDRFDRIAHAVITAGNAIADYEALGEPGVVEEALEAMKQRWQDLQEILETYQKLDLISDDFVEDEALAWSEFIALGGS